MKCYCDFSNLSAYMASRILQRLDTSYSDIFCLQKRNVMLDPNLPDILRTRLAEKLSSGVFSQVLKVYVNFLLSLLFHYFIVVQRGILAI